MTPTTESECRICSPATHTWDGGPDSWADAWEAWRAHYDTLTFAEHQAFSVRVHEAFPDQQHWTRSAWARFMPPDFRGMVVELGGYDGSLARHALDRTPGITRWTNYELFPGAADISVCMDERYTLVVLDDQFWNLPQIFRPAVFVATHTIEHIRSDELEACVYLVGAPIVYFEAPLLESDFDWVGYSASHRLERGWDWVTQMMREHGYAPHGAGDCRWYTR